MFRKLSLVIPLLATAAFAAPKLHLTGIAAYEEYSDQSNQVGSHVFVVTFDHKVRNRGGFLVAKVDGKTLRLPVRSTVGEVDGRQIAYDKATPQLEVREWETHFLDGFGDDSAEREATLRGLVGSEVSLELETCPEEFHLGVDSVKDSHFLDPQFQRPGHEFALIVLKTDELASNNNGDIRTTLHENGELKYVWFFLYPRTGNAPHDEVRLNTHAFHLGLKDAALADALVGRTLAVKSSGNRPWLPLPDPTPGSHLSGCFQ